MSVWPLPRITFRDLSSVEEKRPVALLTSESVWAVLSTQLRLPVLIQAEPDRPGRELFEYLADNLPAQVKALYVVGEGAALHAGKFVASRRNLPLIVVPTALDSDMMLTSDALVEDETDGMMRRVPVETGPATEILIDWDVIQGAPPARRGAGIVDVLSIVTGLLDWRYAAKKGKNTRAQRFVPWAAGSATGLAKEAVKIAAALGQGDIEALQTLLHLMMASAQLCNQIGHTRLNQGAEHYLAQILAAQSPLTESHAEVIGPCLLFVAALHEQPYAPLREALNQAGVRMGQLSPTDVRLALNNLAAYLAHYNFPYSILNDLDPDSEQVRAALEAAGLTLKPDTWDMPEAETWDPVNEVSQMGLSPHVEAPHDEKTLPDDGMGM